ncbi:hypothetical protein [Leptospira noguchii]|nr:hypothetical protein [Leptospira noguchii]
MKRFLRKRLKLSTTLSYGSRKLSVSLLRSLEVNSASRFYGRSK